MKYSGKSAEPKVSVSGRTDPRKQEHIYLVRDNGVGFDMAYAHRLFEWVGDMLGLERFMAVECVFKAGQGEGVPGQAGGQERCLLFKETNGDTVLVRPRAEGDLRALRETLGLGPTAVVRQWAPPWRPCVTWPASPAASSFTRMGG